MRALVPIRKLISIVAIAGLSSAAHGQFRCNVALVLLLISFGTYGASAERVWRIQHTGVEASLRGLCVVNADVVWASGTNMCVLLDRVYIALGGGQEGQLENTSRIIYSLDRAKTWHSATVPVPRAASRGIFSVAFADINQGIAVGGDYTNPSASIGNIAVTKDGGETWTRPSGTIPRGFRSGVAVRKMGSHIVWVAVGPTGSDYSVDGGQNWSRASDTGFHAVQFSPDASSGFASGANGRLGKWIGE